MCEKRCHADNYNGVQPCGRQVTAAMVTPVGWTGDLYLHQDGSLFATVSLEGFYVYLWAASL